MKTNHLLDPELLTAFQGNPPILNIDASNLAEMRTATIEMMVGFVMEGMDDVTIEYSTEMPVILYRPKSQKSILPVLFHIHSGGFVLGNAKMCEGYCRKMATDLECVVISVDYRLAPEFPFPAGLEDCYAALLWVWKNHDKLKIDRKKIAIIGESGGGGLAAQLAFLVRDRKEVEIIFQYLVYPMLDNRTSSTIDPGQFTGEFFWTGSSNRFAWNAYLTEKGMENPPYPSVPTRTESLQGLAPVYMCVGTLDLFASENIRYAESLMRAGVSVEMHLYAGATHGFDFAITTELSKLFFAERKRVLKKVFAKESDPILALP